MRSQSLALALLLAWPLQPIDDAARAWVLGIRSPWLDPVMHAASERAPVLLPVTLAVSVAAGPPGRAFFGEAACALIPVNLAVEGLKWAVDRTRPDGGHNRRNSSFPSSHAANAFVLAILIARRWRRWAIPAGLAAATVAFSRLYLDRHWLSDVLGAAALAALGSWGAVELMHRVRARMEAAKAS